MKVEKEIMAPDLSAGVARVTITPPIGIPMIGFAGRGPAAGIHDDLTATALVLEGPAAQLGGDTQGAGVSRLAVIACDLLFLRPDEVRAVREAVGRLTDVPPDQVVIACSHTHYGPLTEPGRDEQSPLVEAYLANLVHLLTGAVAMARAATVPCRLSFGQGQVSIGINRRERTADGQIILGQNPSGPVDRRVAVLRIDGIDGRPLAAVLNYACHPVSLGSQCTDISADFPGTARRLVEEQTGATCLFLQGATGNINPLLMGWDWTHLARLGLPLGAEAVRIYLSIPPGAEPANGGLGVARSKLELPPLLPASIEEGRETIATLERERERLSAEGNEGALWWAELRLDRARKRLAALQGGTPVPPVEAELVALRLSDSVGVITVPGEIFTEIGQSIVTRSPFQQTLFAAYTNGTIGYVPTRAAYAEGGYEVTHACQVAPAAGEQIEEESIRLLRSVHDVP
jgi:neutral ceramidase